MKRLSGLLCAAGSMLGLLAASAQALPPILDRVPTSALVVVTTPSLDHLEKSIQSITTTLELPLPGVKEMLMMQGFDAGVDLTKPIAAVVMADPNAKPAKPADPADPMAGDEPREEPPIILLIPTSDYKALLKAFKVDAGAGITEFVGPEGDPAFAKDIGEGYAAIGNKKEILEKFDGKGGNAKAHSDLIGKIGNTIGEKADLLVIANIPNLAPIAKPAIEQGMAEAMEDAAGMMNEGMDVEGAKAAVNAFFDQTNGAVLALDIEPTGVAIDCSAQYKAGTMLAGAFAKGGDSSALIAKLPNQPYLFNYAVDISPPAFKKFVKDTMTGAAADPANKELPTSILTASIDDADGMSSSIGFSPAALFGGGLLVNTASYIKSPKPAELISNWQKVLEALNTKTVAGSTYTTAFTKAGAKVNNVDVDVWEMKATPGDEDPMGGQMSMMMFGPAGGPGGFMAPTEGGVVTTMSKNQLLMAASMDAAKGTNAMGDEAMTKQVAERLPKGRVAEVYIGVKSIMESVKPMLAMMGGPAQFDIPEQLPPVGAGVGAGDSASHMTLFIPMPVIKTVGAAIKAANQPPAPGPAPAAQPGQPAGQPRF